MTLRRGVAWGREIPRPQGLVTVDSDRSLVEALTDTNPPPLAIGSGDLARTLGVASFERSASISPTVSEFPIDLVQVRLDDSDEPIVACAHVVACAPRRRGHWLRGPILAVMNAEFIGEWDVAPRGHPNDGRVEVFEVDSSMSLRQRLSARRRLRTGPHVPHPSVSTRSVRSGTWNFVQALDVRVDGRQVGRASSLSIQVMPDAAIVHA